MARTAGRLLEQAKGGWSQSGNLIQGNYSQRVTLACNFPKSTYYTAQFGIQIPTVIEEGFITQIVVAPGNSPTSPPLLLQPFAFRAMARLEWSVEGNRIQRRIDIGNGATISAPGQAVKIVMEDATPYFGVDPVTGFNASIVYYLFGNVSVVNGSPVIVFPAAQFLPTGTQIIFIDPLAPGGGKPLQPVGVSYVILSSNPPGSNPAFQFVLGNPTTGLPTPYTGPTHLAAAAFTPFQYTVTVQVSERVRPVFTAPPQLLGFSSAPLDPIHTAPPGQFEYIIGVPQDAGVSSVEVVGINSATGAPPTGLSVAHIVGNSALVTKQYNPVVNTGFVPLVPNANAVRVLNNSTTETLGVSLTWGIDG